MSSGAEKWSDLTVRLASGAALVILGLFSVWVGGTLFHCVVACACGLMIWELVRMIAPQASGVAVALSGFSGILSLLAIHLPFALALPLLLLPAVIGWALLTTFRKSFALFAALVLLAGFGVMVLRDTFGLGWTLWLVLIVIATDVLGYFAGRMLGGPKFWPKISPKKTWSGTVFGWIGAAGVGVWYMVETGAGPFLIVLSVAVSFASQMGDIAESAMKRRVGVKDSSNLIPGHGGLMDRFDGMMGASILLLLIGPLVTFPPI